MPEREQPIVLGSFICLEELSQLVAQVTLSSAEAPHAHWRLRSPISLRLPGFEIAETGLKSWGTLEGYPRLGPVWVTEIEFQEHLLNAIKKLVASQWETRTGPKIQRKEASKNDDAHSNATAKMNLVVDPRSITASVRSYPITRTSAWATLSKKYPGVELFAIDADPRSFDVTKAALMAEQRF
jgi:hypothetical protein